MLMRRPTMVAALVALTLTSVGVLPGVAAGEPSYRLPAPAGTVLTVAQGNGHPTGRLPQERYAYDFVATAGTPPRFPVVAARGGTIISQRTNVPGGRCNEPANRARPACWLDVNYVLIDHGDGTSGLYLHLKRDKPVLRRGDVVSAGQRIGSAGSSGWTNEIGVQFQLQPTPTWDTWSTPGWFQTEALEVAFSDPSVVDQAADGVPATGATVVSDNTAPLREPFRFERRSVDLPASMPLEIGLAVDLSGSYDADSPDGYGLQFAPAEVASTAVAADQGGASPDPLASDDPPNVDAGTLVRPLFGGELVYAGCASGASASLGRMVVIRRRLDEVDYLAVIGHLSDIDPLLLADSFEASLQVGPNDTLGHYGAVLLPDALPELDCPAADPAATDLFAGILRDAAVSPEGEISGGVPISPEPLLGRGGYEDFAGWAGPVQAGSVADDAGRPRIAWTRQTAAHSAHIAYGDPVKLSARVRDVADVREVRFRAYYPDWPRVRSSQAFDSFDPKKTWRLLAVCRPPGVSGEPSRTRGCTWDGDSNAAVVSYDWQPTQVEDVEAAPWLPRVRAASGTGITQCVPVSLLAEVLDEAGHYGSSVVRGLTPAKCDQRGVDRNDAARVVYLDPFAPPLAPRTRGKVDDRGWPPVYAPDPLEGAIVWRDRSNNEDGFRIYARRSWLQADCSITNGKWRPIDTVAPDTRRYRPRHNKVVRDIPVPTIPNVPGNLVRWEYAVSSYNSAGESVLVPVGGFIGGSEAYCDQGLEPPPDL
jgi:Peptidase family M23